MTQLAYGFRVLWTDPQTAPGASSRSDGIQVVDLNIDLVQHNDDDDYWAEVCTSCGHRSQVNRLWQVQLPQTNTRNRTSRRWGNWSRSRKVPSAACWILHSFSTHLVIAQSVLLWSIEVTYLLTPIWQLFGSEPCFETQWKACSWSYWSAMIFYGLSKTSIGKGIFKL